MCWIFYREKNYYIEACTTLDGEFVYNIIDHTAADTNRDTGGVLIEGKMSAKELLDMLLEKEAKHNVYKPKKD